MLHSFKTALAPVLVLTALAIAVPLRADTVLYSTSFESPTFTTGPLLNQNGWNVYGPSTPTVENYFAKTGTQAVFVDGGTASQSGPYHQDLSAGPMISLSADIAIFTASTQSAWQFAALGPGLVGYLGGIDIGVNDQIIALTAGNPVIGTFARATSFSGPGAVWNNVNLLFDIANQTYSISINGVTLDSNVPFCGANGSCSGATLSTYGEGFFDSFGTGNDSAYMDNYSVTVLSSGVPEPSSALPLLSILLSAVGIGLRRAIFPRQRLSERLD